VTSDNFVVVDLTTDERVIGETDFTSGPSTLHEKAIYLVEGTLYQVERLDFEGRKAFVRHVECDYYTDAITYTKVTILDTFTPADHDGGGTVPEQAGISTAALAAHGEVHVRSRVVGFKKIKFYTNENIGSGELELPEQQMHTTSYWLTIPRQVMGQLACGSADRRDGVIGLAHAMRNVAPLLLMCDRHDLGMSIDGLSLDGGNRLGWIARGEAPPELSADPMVFLYDNYPGGIGFSEPLFGMHETVLARTRGLIEGCPCTSGCPSCVGPEGATGPLAKAAASYLLGALTGTSTVL
jgi:DEAD/DEAH box helicase domain-containing protein